MVHELKDGRKLEVRMWDSCGSIRCNMTVDGKLIEQHVFPAGSAEASECYEKMVQGANAALAVLNK